MRLPDFAWRGISLGIVTVYSLLAAWRLAQWPFIIQFDLGLVIGVALMWLDEFWAYRWYQVEPQNGHQGKQLVTRSVVMGLGYLVLAIWLLTSSGSLIGMGLITSILLVYSLELWQWQDRSTEFAERFLWQIHRRFSPAEEKWLCWFSSLLTLFLAILQLR